MAPGPVLIAAMIVIPILLLAFCAGFAYVDAPNYGMNPYKWALISFVIPFFGFFAYLFERDERTPDPDRDMYTDSVFNIHENRADDTRLARGNDPDGIDEDDDEEFRREPSDEWER
ncbi:hypothetical protein [Halovenus halobia]|uniref:hypothetical protein n=1 Tax=Halovenus halobia TaxID=3396622 RepID=UPI003F544657